jgi:hypothetical protein
MAVFIREWALWIQRFSEINGLENEPVPLIGIQNVGNVNFLVNHIIQVSPFHLGKELRGKPLVCSFLVKYPLEIQKAYSFDSYVSISKVLGFLNPLAIKLSKLLSRIK